MPRVSETWGVARRAFIPFSDPMTAPAYEPARFEGSSETVCKSARGAKATRTRALNELRAELAAWPDTYGGEKGLWRGETVSADGQAVTVFYVQRDTRAFRNGPIFRFHTVRIES